MRLLTSCFVLGVVLSSAACGGIGLDRSGCIVDDECSSGERCDLTTSTCGTKDVAGRGPTVLPDGTGCSQRLQIDNDGGPEGALPVLVSLPRFGKLRTDGANLRFTTPAGVDLPFALDQVAIGTVAAWVRLPALPHGPTIVNATACDDVTGRANPKATFDYVTTADPLEVARWTLTCDAQDEATEICAASISPEDSGARFVVQATASCQAATSDGLRSRITRDLQLPAGSYALDVIEQAEAQHYAFCNGQTGGATRIELGADEVVLDQNQLGGLTNCDTATSPVTAVSLPFTSDGAAQSLALVADSGDCAATTYTLDGVRARRVAETPPRVSISTP